jgi:hypothetical protein
MCSMATAPRFSSRRSIFRVPRDRNDRRFPRQPPHECDLGGCGALSGSNMDKEIDHGSIGFAHIGRKARKPGPHVRCREGHAGVDLRREKALAERAPGMIRAHRTAAALRLPGRGSIKVFTAVIAKSASMSLTSSVAIAFFPISARDLHDAGELACTEIMAKISYRTRSFMIS